MENCEAVSFTAVAILMGLMLLLLDCVVRLTTMCRRAGWGRTLLYKTPHHEKLCLMKVVKTWFELQPSPLSWSSLSAQPSGTPWMVVLSKLYGRVTQKIVLYAAHELWDQSSKTPWREHGHSFKTYCPKHGFLLPVMIEDWICKLFLCNKTMTSYMFIM